MQLHVPAPIWAGQDAFVIGGGASLRGFDWSLLECRNTIGCNAAFTLGVNFCKVCHFSDWKWFIKFESDLKDYALSGGKVITHLRTLIPRKRMYNLDWIEIMAREKNGLHHDALGFGGNSGCSAVNLALIMGTKRVFLLGFDCKITNPVQTHWHDLRIDRPSAIHYEKFMQGWQALAEHLPVKFPGCEIINLNPDSAIPFFPKLEPSQILSHAPDYAHAAG